MLVDMGLRKVIEGFYIMDLLIVSVNVFLCEDGV